VEFLSDDPSRAVNQSSNRCRGATCSCSNCLYPLVHCEFALGSSCSPIRRIHREIPVLRRTETRSSKRVSGGVRRLVSRKSPFQPSGTPLFNSRPLFRRLRDDGATFIGREIDFVAEEKIIIS